MQDPKDRSGEPLAATDARAPYEKPAVTWEDHLETRPGLTASCGKVTSAQAECNSVEAS